MAACAGDDPEANIEVLIGQLVKILRGGEEVRLTKRAGTIVTLQELVDLIGVDALRYTLARYPADSPLTLDVEQITRASSDNPVYYVQYAHARLSSILRNAADLGVTADPDAGPELDPACSPTSARATCSARSPSSRAWWPAPPSCASRTGSRATSRTPRRRSTSSTTPAGCCRRATRSPPTSTGPGSRSSPPPGPCSPTAWTLLGVTAPERM